MAAIACEHFSMMDESKFDRTVSTELAFKTILEGRRLQQEGQTASTSASDTGETCSTNCSTPRSVEDNSRNSARKFAIYKCIGSYDEEIKRLPDYPKEIDDEMAHAFRSGKDQWQFRYKCPGATTKRSYNVDFRTMTWKRCHHNEHGKLTLQTQDLQQQRDTTLAEMFNNRRVSEIVTDHPSVIQPILPFSRDTTHLEDEEAFRLRDPSTFEVAYVHLSSLRSLRPPPGL
jgi:hypothetical protein